MIKTMRGLTRVTCAAVLVTSVVGCRAADTVCAAVPNLAVRLHAKDGRTGSAINSPIVSATIIGESAPPEVIVGEPGDSSLVRIFGNAGQYEVTVKKTGYTDLVQRVSVTATGSCLTDNTVDLDVVMTPTQ